MQQLTVEHTGLTGLQLQHHARAALVLMYAVFGLLLIAAFVEAFWSSSAWISHEVKYFSGALCWVGVLVYFIWQARPRRVAIANEGSPDAS